MKNQRECLQALLDGHILKRDFNQSYNLYKISEKGAIVFLNSTRDDDMWLVTAETFTGAGYFSIYEEPTTPRVIEFSCSGEFFRDNRYTSVEPSLHGSTVKDMVTKNWKVRLEEIL